MTAVLDTDGLGKRYRRRWALTDCTLKIPAGRVVGLVGPNGAGKSTLLNLAVGLITPTCGRIDVLGTLPARGSAELGRVGFVAQDTPTYSGLSVADHLRMGARLNPGWDRQFAEDRIAQLGLDPAQRAGKLSGGERAQLALTVAVAKRPELLVLDEPVARLDPLARREFLQSLMEVVADQGVSVVLSSHLVADLERVCDHLIILVASRVRLTGDVEQLLATHHLLTGPRRDTDRLPEDLHVVQESHTDRQSTLLVRTEAPILDPAWTVGQISLEDLVLAYMSQARAGASNNGHGRLTGCHGDLVCLAAVPHPGRRGIRRAGRPRGRGDRHRTAAAALVRRQRYCELCCGWRLRHGHQRIHRTLQLAANTPRQRSDRLLSSGDRGVLGRAAHRSRTRHR